MKAKTILKYVKIASREFERKKLQTADINVLQLELYVKQTTKSARKILKEQHLAKVRNCTKSNRINVIVMHCPHYNLEGNRI